MNIPTNRLVLIIPLLYLLCIQNAYMCIVLETEKKGLSNYTLFLRSCTVTKYEVRGRTFDARFL
jgi:hypothetical protein